MPENDPYRVVEAIVGSDSVRLRNGLLNSVDAANTRIDSIAGDHAIVTGNFSDWMYVFHSDSSAYVPFFFDF